MHIFGGVEIQPFRFIPISRRQRCFLHGKDCCCHLSVASIITSIITISIIIIITFILTLLILVIVTLTTPFFFSFFSSREFWRQRVQRLHQRVTSYSIFLFFVKLPRRFRCFNFLVAGRVHSGWASCFVSIDRSID